VPRRFGSYQTYLSGFERTEVEIKSSYSDKGAIKSLDWEDTHRSWDDEKERWTVDLDSADRVIEELTDNGNTVSVRNEVLMLSDNTSYHPSDDGDEIGEHSWIGETEEKEMDHLRELGQKEE